VARTATIAWIGNALIFAGWGGTEVWFRWKERELEVVPWGFRQPLTADRFENAEQPANVRGMLRYDAHSGGRWRDKEGRLWVAHYFRWEPGRNAIRTVLAHDPRVCLESSGRELVRRLPAFVYDISEVHLPFDQLQFRDAGMDVYLFNCVVEDGRRSGPWSGPSNRLSVASRLDAVLLGNRNMGQRRLEVAVWGARDSASAQAAFASLLRDQLWVGSESDAAKTPGGKNVSPMK
jgi:hypothetical protein